jgi:hypothetical protein
LREDDREMFTFSDDTEMTLQSRTWCFKKIYSRPEMSIPRGTI